MNSSVRIGPNWRLYYGKILSNLPKQIKYTYHRNVSFTPCFFRDRENVNTNFSHVRNVTPDTVSSIYCACSQHAGSTRGIYTRLALKITAVFKKLSNTSLFILHNPFLNCPLQLIYLFIGTMSSGKEGMLMRTTTVPVSINYWCF